jgi:pimeloyl-ACP methyl ester carboxylesterase
MTATVVLVHGAWHGAWCWQPVETRLAAAGVPVLALDLPGHGADTRPLTDLHGHGDALRVALDAIDGPVVLVGHSYGGAAITDGGDHPNVAHLVYLTAFPLDADESIIENRIEDGEHAELADAIEIRDDGTITVDPARAAGIFYADCDPADAHAFVARLIPESEAGFRQTPRSVAWRTRPSTYVVCTNDRALAPGLQRNLARRCTATVEWATSHSPFVSRPDLVTDLLISIVRTIDA